MQRWWPTWRRDVAVLVGCALLGLLGMRGGRVPLLGGVDLGFHELGHMVCYIVDAFLPWPEIVTAAAGSGFQIGVPLGLAAYFGVLRRDRTGAALCLAWAATAALDVARYVADAPFEELQLIGGQHDWAYILGPDQLDRLGQAGHLAALVTDMGWLLFAAGVAVAALPALRWLWFGDDRKTRGPFDPHPSDRSTHRFPV